MVAGSALLIEQAAVNAWSLRIVRSAVMVLPAAGRP
jgi:hypothetical protein